MGNAPGKLTETKSRVIIHPKGGGEMLVLAEKLQQLSFSGLMAVYAEGNLENAEDLIADLAQAIEKV